VNVLRARERRGERRPGDHCSMRRVESIPKERHIARSLRPAPARKLRSRTLSTANLDRLIEEATVDAYGDSEPTVGLHTMLEEHLPVPFAASVLGAEVIVEGVDLTDDERALEPASVWPSGRMESDRPERTRTPRMLRLTHSQSAARHP
jgi:hypothetical protein